MGYGEIIIFFKSGKLCVLKVSIPIKMKHKKQVAEIYV